MKAASLVAPLLMLASSWCVAGDLTKAEYDERFNQAADAIERKYPELKDSDSPFSIILGYKVLRAQAEKDPSVKDPYYLMRFADDLAKELEELGLNRKSAHVEAVPEVKIEKSTTAASGPTAEQLAERKEQELAKAGNMDSYLAQAKKGHVGADPKLQSRARGGDPLAKAEMDKDSALRKIKGRIAAGYITEAEAAAERAAVQTTYTATVQQIQSAVQHEELMDELQKRRR